MRFKFNVVVEVEVEREQGKFASKDEIRDQLDQVLLDADPGSITADAGGEYNTVLWEVS